MCNIMPHIFVVFTIVVVMNKFFCNFAVDITFLCKLLINIIIAKARPQQRQ